MYHFYTYPVINIYKQQADFQIYSYIQIIDIDVKLIV